jgi:hypothetical protein
MVARVLLVIVVAILSWASAADAQSRREPRRVGLDEHATLTRIVDEAAQGSLSNGFAWLTWTPHFFRGPDGKTYVPFTLTIDEAPGAFASVALYVRVAPRGDEGRKSRKGEGVDNILDVGAGELPVNAPGRRIGGPGAPNPSEASIRLRGLSAEQPAGTYAFEDAYGVEPAVDAPERRPMIRRALAVAPGDYDVYFAVLERDRKGEKKWAVVKQEIAIPDLSRGRLRLSSIILADRVESLTEPVPPAQHALRPYTLGRTELVPALDTELGQDETLHVAFVIYDATPDAAGKPDVRIDYRLFQQNLTSERLLGATSPQTLDPASLPEGFDLRRGEQLATMQSLPLASYAPGPYRLAIQVTDNRTGAKQEESVMFVIK